MLKAVQQEFALLRQKPELNLNRYHQIIDTYFGLSFSDPSIASTDWFTLIVLVLVAIPFIVLLGLWVARHSRVNLHKLLLQLGPYHSDSFMLTPD